MKQAGTSRRTREIIVREIDLVGGRHHPKIILCVFQCLPFRGRNKRKFTLARNADCELAIGVSLGRRYWPMMLIQFSKIWGAAEKETDPAPDRQIQLGNFERE